jgi:DNA excision repair protein ERCC-2
MDTKPLKFAYTRLNSLLRAVQVTDVDEYSPLQLVTDFVTLLATYPSGFMVILEPYNPASVHSAMDPVLQLTCMGKRCDMVVAARSAVAAQVDHASR